MNDSMVGLKLLVDASESVFDVAIDEGGLRLSPQAAVEQAVYQILLGVGEDPERDGLKDTPRRVARMYAEMLEGYTRDAKTVVNGALFDVEYGAGEMVVVSDIPFSSMCEHHMLPFTGKAHVAYVPGEKVVGLSKIPRLLDMYAHRLQVQERLTNQVADALQDTVRPLGVMVVVEGHHSCASLRGVKKHGANMITTAERGKFRDDPRLREEFYRLIGK
jgi:GTP cyclohydrolase I